jgi:predicted acyl esterase
MTLGAGLNRAQASVTDPPSNLTWTSEPLKNDLDVVGDIELELDAISTAADTAWIVILQDVDSTGAITNVTAGYLRAGLREVDEAASRAGVPELPCRGFQAVPVGELVHYRIPMVANARRFKTGNRVQLFLTSDDQDSHTPALLTFRHATVGTSSLNIIRSSSRLMLPVMRVASC